MFKEGASTETNDHTTKKTQRNSEENKTDKETILKKEYPASVKKDLVTNNTAVIISDIATDAALPESSTINFEFIDARQATTRKQKSEF